MQLISLFALYPLFFVFCRLFFVHCPLFFPFLLLILLYMPFILFALHFLLFAFTFPYLPSLYLRFLFPYLPIIFCLICPHLPVFGSYFSFFGPYFFLFASFFASHLPLEILPWPLIFYLPLSSPFWLFNYLLCSYFYLFAFKLALCLRLSNSSRGRNKDPGGPEKDLSGSEKRSGVSYKMFRSRGKDCSK